MKQFAQTAFFTSVVFLALSVSVTEVSWVYAQVMSSSNYSIERDSVNFGGAQGSSASYGVEDTLGEVGTGDSSSTNYRLRAGYQQMDAETFITMSAAADVTMSPTLGGLTGGSSNGSTATTIETNNSAGYELYIKASTSPAMQGNTQGDFIDNFTIGAPQFFFVAASTQALFGFTPEGLDVAPDYLDDGGGTCSTGSSETADRCWSGVPTTNELIATRASSNSPGGTVTTLKFRIALGSSTFTVEDTYTATATLTALTI